MPAALLLLPSSSSPCRAVSAGRGSLRAHQSQEALLGPSRVRTAGDRGPTMTTPCSLPARGRGQNQSLRRGALTGALGHGTQACEAVTSPDENKKPCKDGGEPSFATSLSEQLMTGNQTSGEKPSKQDMPAFSHFAFRFSVLAGSPAASQQAGTGLEFQEVEPWNQPETIPVWRCHTGCGGRLRREDQAKEPQAKAREGSGAGWMRRRHSTQGDRPVPEREGRGPPESLHAACRLRGKAKVQAASELPRARPARNPQHPGGLCDSPEGRVAVSEEEGSEPGVH